MVKIEIIKDQVGEECLPEIRIHFTRSAITKQMCRTPEDLADLLRQLFDQGTMDIQEESLLLFLDNNDHPVGFYRLAKGTKGEVATDVKLIFQILLCVSADKFVLSHNHPSENALASGEDMKVTHSIGLVASFLDIEFVDHIVITRDGHFSFAEEGLLWV